jgi:hypothetical protein
MTYIDRQTENDRLDIHQQVEKILQHPLFHQSKRLPAFLRYIVDQSLIRLDGDSIKERTLGIEVFGRNPDYDNNSDPVVRVTATELRKKLAQYYYEDGHSDEIRIELPPGRYLPKFRRSQVGNTAATHFTMPAAAPAELTAVTDQEPGTPPAQVQVAVEKALPARDSRRPRRMVFGVVCVFVIVALTFSARFAWRQTHSPLDGFWRQVVGNSNNVLIVMPVIGSDNNQATGVQIQTMSAKPTLSLEDAEIAVRIVGQLERRNANYRLVSSPDVSVDQLRTGPAILIGALDNVWTTRLSQKLPFIFEETADHRTGRIVDMSSGGSRSWVVDINTPHSRIAQDYGVVARYTNQLTGQPVVLVAGICSQGTQAAGELLTSPEFESIRDIAASGRNFEVIVHTEAIDGHAGQPQIVTTKVW